MLFAQFVVQSYPFLAIIYDCIWRTGSRLFEYVKDDNGIAVNTINDSPRLILIYDPQFMTLMPDRRHRARMGKRKAFSPLQLSQQITSFNPALL